MGGVLQEAAARDGNSNAMPTQLLRHRKSDAQLDSREVVDRVPSQRRLMVRAKVIHLGQKVRFLDRILHNTTTRQDKKNLKR